MFSEAISSISCRCRPSSPLIAAAISGSASARVAVKKESGAEAVLAEELIGEIYPPPQRVRPAGGSGLAVVSRACAIPHRPELAMHMRNGSGTLAIYGGT